MPAALPPTSGYTYAVELSVDQALAAGATGVHFNKPLPFYVDNFLGIQSAFVCLRRTTTGTRPHGFQRQTDG